MALYIKDEETSQLVAALAQQLGTTKCRAVKLAVEAQLGERRREKAADGVPLRDRIAALRAARPLPAPTGLEADKAFFDELSGDL